MLGMANKFPQLLQMTPAQLSQRLVTIKVRLAGLHLQTLL